MASAPPHTHTSTHTWRWSPTHQQHAVVHVALWATGGREDRCYLKQDWLARSQMREREESKKQSDRKQVGNIMFVHLHAKQPKWEQYSDSVREHDRESVWERNVQNVTLQTFNFQFNFPLKIKSLFGVKSVQVSRTLWCVLAHICLREKRVRKLWVWTWLNAHEFASTQANVHKLASGFSKAKWV